MAPIQIEYHQDGPISLFQRAANGDIQVRLSASGRHWSQHAYQFAHEACHILCRHKDGDMSNMWFEESICEMASIFALRQMAKEWAHAPPYPNWADYARHLQAYADNIARNPDHQLPPDIDFRTWWQQQRPALTANHKLRAANTIVALQLLPLLENHPAGWEAFHFLNGGRTSQARSFEEYLASWRAHSPERHHAFIDRIRRSFPLAE